MSYRSDHTWEITNILPKSVGFSHHIINIKLIKRDPYSKAAVLGPWVWGNQALEVLQMPFYLVWQTRRKKKNSFIKLYTYLIYHSSKMLEKLKNAPWKLLEFDFGKGVGTLSVSGDTNKWCTKLGHTVLVIICVLWSYWSHWCWKMT